MALVDSLQAAQEASLTPQFASLQKKSDSHEFSNILNSLRTEHSTAQASHREPEWFHDSESTKIQSPSPAETPRYSRESQRLQTPTRERELQQKQNVQDKSLKDEHTNNGNPTDDTAVVTADNANRAGKEKVGEDSQTRNQSKTSLKTKKPEQDSSTQETSGKILPDQKEPAPLTDGDSAKQVSGESAVKSDLWAQVQSMILAINPQDLVQLITPTQNSSAAANPISTAASSADLNMQTMLENLGSNLDKLALLLQNQKDFIPQAQFGLNIPGGLSQQMVAEIRQTLSQILKSPENIAPLQTELAKMNLSPINELIANISSQVDSLKKDNLKNTNVELSIASAALQNNQDNLEAHQVPLSFPMKTNETTSLSNPVATGAGLSGIPSGTKTAYSSESIVREVDLPSRNSESADELQAALSLAAQAHSDPGTSGKTPMEPSLRVFYRQTSEPEDQAGSNLNNKESVQQFKMEGTEKNKAEQLNEQSLETAAKSAGTAASVKNVQPAVLMSNDRLSTIPDVSAKSTGPAEPSIAHSLNPDAVIAKAAQQSTVGSAVRTGEQNSLWASVDKANVFSQIVDKARLLSGKQDSEILISLKPEFLGRMSVRTALMGNEIVASISTESQQVRNLLESHLPALRNSLSEQGVQVSRIEIVHDAGLSLTDLNQGNSPSHQNTRAGQNIFIPLRDSGMDSEDASLETKLPPSIPLSSSGIVNLVA